MLRFMPLLCRVMSFVRSAGAGTCSANGLMQATRSNRGITAILNPRQQEGAVGHGKPTGNTFPIVAAVAGTGGQATF
jgi:hypothetical protein